MSRPTHTIIGQSGTFDLEYIEEGYTSTITLPFSKIEKENNQISIFDDGSDYDKYSCEFSCVMTADAFTNLNAIYEDDADYSFTIIPNVGSSGFSPFTPAFGDNGSYQFKIKSLKQSGTLDDERYQWFRVSFSIIMAVLPSSYSPTLEAVEGNLTIGSVGGLRYPIGGYKPSVEYDVGTASTGSIPMGSNQIAYAQNWLNSSSTSKMTIRALFGRASFLLKHLLSVRAQELSILAPQGHYPYGPKNGDNQSFTSRLISRQIVVKHVNNQRYDISLEFQRVQ